MRACGALFPHPFPLLNPKSGPSGSSTQGGKVTVPVAERLPFEAAFRVVRETEERSDLAVDRCPPESLHRPLVRREDQPERPRGKRCQEGVVAPEKWSEVHQGRT